MLKHGKRFVAIFSSLILSCITFGQDSIRLACGDVLPVKITEVGLKDVTYTPIDHQDQTILIRKTDINYLRFSDGEVNRINNRKISWATNSSAPGFTKINIIQNDLRYKGSWISKKELYDLANHYPFAEGKTKLAIEMAEMQHLKNKKSLGNGLIITGWIVPLIASYIFTGAAYDESVKDGRPYIATLATGVVVGAACRISGYYLFFKSRNKVKAQYLRIAEVYNETK